VLNEIRRLMSKDLDMHLEGPALVSIFLYDNKTVIVENFNDTPVEVKLAGADLKTFTDLESGEVIEAGTAAPAAGGFFFGRMGPPEPKATVTIPATLTGPSATTQNRVTSARRRIPRYHESTLLRCSSEGWLRIPW
jgi:hypothetical protein